MKGALPAVVLFAVAAGCGGSGDLSSSTSSPTPTPSREPSTLPQLSWEPQVLEGLRREGIAVTLIGGSKFESMLGPTLPARVFISRPGGEGADVLFLDRSVGAVSVCTSYTDGLWSYTIAVDGRTVSRGEGTQHVLFSVSPAFFVQAIGERSDAALRQTLGNFPVRCQQPATSSADVAAACPRTRASDASGVVTTNGVVGIAGETYVSARAVNDVFTMVRRDSKLGDLVTVSFAQVGSSAPATSVAYGVRARPERTPWGDLAFPLGVKPIGFVHSCWRLLVDGSDTGIVLEIGP